MAPTEDQVPGDELSDEQLETVYGGNDGDPDPIEIIDERLNHLKQRP